MDLNSTEDRKSTYDDDDFDDDFRSPSPSSETRSSGSGRPEKLTPMKDTGLGALIPLKDCEVDDVQSEDSLSIRSFDNDTLAVSGFNPDYSKASSVKEDVKNRALSAKSVQSTSTISREDLKQALLSIMERKDEIQAQCESLKRQLAQETEGNGTLKDELAEQKRRGDEKVEKLEMRIQSLSRENELLKHQLRKYVGAVQKLRDGPQAYETLAELENNKHDGKNKPKYVDYHFEASEYEKKLIQVAEMHGELIEFNEHLQKLVQSKDHLIKRMRDELIDLRGPLPEDHEQVREESHDDGEESSRVLLHTWIPSVFLSSGSGRRTHHVYQVHLRIKNEEWNIYRRYSEFLCSSFGFEEET